MVETIPRLDRLKQKELIQFFNPFWFPPIFWRMECRKACLLSSPEIAVFFELMTFVFGFPLLIIYVIFLQTHTKENLVSDRVTNYQKKLKKFMSTFLDSFLIVNSTFYKCKFEFTVISQLHAM